MTYFLFLLILFNRPGDIRDVIHVDTIHGKRQCLERMAIAKKTGKIPEINMPKIPKGAVLVCTPLKTEVEKI